MKRLADFLDRLDTARDLERPPEDLVHDEAMEEAGRILAPMFARRAERAGVELDDLQIAIAERIEPALKITLGRMVAGDDAVGEIRTLAHASGLQFFLAGVLWEQERHLPDLGDPA